MICEVLAKYRHSWEVSYYYSLLLAFPVRGSFPMQFTNQSKATDKILYAIPPALQLEYL